MTSHKYRRCPLCRRTGAYRVVQTDPNTGNLVPVVRCKYCEASVQVHGPQYFSPEFEKQLQSSRRRP